MDLKDVESKIGEGWRIVDGHHLRCEVTFKNFVDALAFVNKVGAYAESVNHHPDIYLAWGKVSIEIWTHTKDGITALDIAFSEAIDRLI
ncbi:MAG: 4a-hydroxytetrahydrobiopterin dehydratase [bacterium]|nr:4a-hydroxytetrahydrobiopterin dehydratase [bacterium]